MELFDYLNAVRRRWYVPAALLLLTLIVVWLVTDPSPPRRVADNVTYNARTTLIASGDRSGGGANLQLTAFLVTTGDIPELAAEMLDADEAPALLARSVTATPNPELGALQITATDPDPDRAVLLSDTFAQATIQFFADRAQSSYQDQASRLDQRLRTSTETIRDIDAQLRASPPPTPTEAALLEAQRDSAVNQYRIDYEAFRQLATQGPRGAGLDVLQTATAIPVEAEDSGFKAPESRPARMLVGGGAALAVGVILALVIDRLDTRLRTREEFEDAYGAPVLTEIPAVAKRKRTEFLPALQPARRMLVHREAHRSLRTQIQLRINERAADGGRHTVIVVTSALPREGKTTTVASLAASFAETGRTVLVLSADFRRPAVHRQLGVREEGPGLADVLAGNLPLAECVIDTAVEGVRMVPRGTGLSYPQNLLDHGAELLDAARELADIVIVDTAPVLLSADTAEIVVRADHVIVVGRSGRTGRTPAVRAGDLLASLTEIAGVVVVGSAIEGTARYAYYYGDAASAPRQTATANGTSHEPVPVGAGAPEPQPSNGPRHAAQRSGPRPVVMGAPLYRRQPGCFVVAGLGGVIGHMSGTIGDIPLSDDALFVWEALTVPATADAIAGSLARLTGVAREGADARTSAALEELVSAGLVDRVG